MKAGQDWTAVAIEAGRRARVAVERWDVHAATVAWKERAKADARRKGYDDAGFIGFESDPVRYGRTFAAAGTLGFSPDREADSFRFLRSADHGRRVL